MSSCKPSFVLVYKSEPHGHMISIDASILKNNESDFDNLMATHVEEENRRYEILLDKLQSTGQNDSTLTLDQEKAKKYSHVQHNKRLENIRTGTYANVNIFDYIRADQNNYMKIRDKIKASPSKAKKVLDKQEKIASAEYKQYVEEVQSFIYQDLQFFLKNRYDIVCYFSGTMDKFLDIETTGLLKDYNKILIYNYNTDWKENKSNTNIVDLYKDYNIGLIIGYFDAILIYVDEEIALKVSGGKVITENHQLLRLIDEYARIAKYINYTKQRLAHRGDSVEDGEKAKFKGGDSDSTDDSSSDSSNTLDASGGAAAGNAAVGNGAAGSNGSGNGSSNSGDSNEFAQAKETSEQTPPKNATDQTTVSTAEPSLSSNQPTLHSSTQPSSAHQTTPQDESSIKLRKTVVLGGDDVVKDRDFHSKLFLVLWFCICVLLILIIAVMFTKKIYPAYGSSDDLSSDD